MCKTNRTNCLFVDSCNGIFGEWEYFKESDSLSKSFNQFIYHDSKWAEILSQTPEIIISAHKREFFKSYVKFGWVKIDKDIFIGIYHINKYVVGTYSTEEIESITIGKEVFSKEQIKQIVEYYLFK